MDTDVEGGATVSENAVERQATSASAVERQATSASSIGYMVPTMTSGTLRGGSTPQGAVGKQATSASSYGFMDRSGTNGTMTKRSSGSVFRESLRGSHALRIVTGVQGQEKRGSENSSGSDSELSPAWRTIAKSNSRVDDPSLLRGVPATNVLRSFARVLSKTPSSTDYYTLSKEVPHIDTFMSHTWSTPRWEKFLVLIFHFNLKPALLISNLVGALMCVLTVQGILPNVDATIHISREGFEYTQGVLCLPAGLVAFFVSLLLLHELDRFGPSRCHTLFLDKACVHQQDTDRKRKGIQSLAAFIQNSKSILVLYSDVYMMRLWTTYEVASWIMLHKGQKMVLRPVSAPLLLLCGCACFVALEALVLVVNVTHFSSALYPLPGFAAGVLCIVPTFTIGAWLCARGAISLERIESHVGSFTLAGAQCSNEDDRRMVQSNIVAFMKFKGLAEPDEEDPHVFQRFEELVRREVPKLMWASFGRVGVPYTWALVCSLPRALVMYDYVAGEFLAFNSGRRTSLGASFHVAHVFLIGPLILAFIVTLTRRTRFRGALACIGIGLIATGLLSFSIIAFDALVHEAVSSDLFLGLLLALCAGLMGATFAIYRPLSLS